MLIKFVNVIKCNFCAIIEFIYFSLEIVFHSTCSFSVHTLLADSVKRTDVKRAQGQKKKGKVREMHLKSQLSKT